MVRIMKVTANRHEFAEMIRACEETINGAGCICNCALYKLCEGNQKLEEWVRVKQDDDERD